MANIGVTEKQVFTAADALKQVGIEPTIVGIREKLGNTGSLTTISKYLKAWKDHQELITPLSEPPIAFNQSAKALWNVAFRFAEEEFKSQSEALKIDKKKWEEEKKLYTSELEGLEVQKSTIERRLKEIEKILETERTEFDKKIQSMNKISDLLHNAQGEIKSLKERLKSEADRNDDLQKQIMSFLKKK